jgi:hypothetical protein
MGVDQDVRKRLRWREVTLVSNRRRARVPVVLICIYKGCLLVSWLAFTVSRDDKGCLYDDDAMLLAALVGGNEHFCQKRRGVVGDLHQTYLNQISQTRR